MKMFDKTIGFNLGSAICKRCKKQFPYNTLGNRPVYCSDDCERLKDVPVLETMNDNKRK